MVHDSIQEPQQTFEGFLIPKYRSSFLGPLVVVWSRGSGHVVSEPRFVPLISTPYFLTILSYCCYTFLMQHGDCREICPREILISREQGKNRRRGADSVGRLIYKLVVFTRANRGLFAILQLNNRT